MTSEATKPVILLIDDDPNIRTALSELLENEGYDVATAEGGGEALEVLRSGLRPAVILLDLLMPGIDGWDFRAAQLEHESFAEIPVVVISASGFSERTVCSQLNTPEYLTKPLEPLALTRTLARVARRRPALH